MNRLYNYTLTIVAALASVACSSSESHDFGDPMVLSREQIIANIFGGEFPIDIVHPSSYQLNYNEDADWITVTQTSSTTSGGTYLTIFISQNLTTEARDAIISVTITDPDYFDQKIGTYTKEIRVYQDQGEPWAYFLCEGEESLTVPADGKTTYLSIKTNLSDYKVNLPDWITIGEKTEDSEWDTYPITIEPNPDRWARHDYIQIYNESYYCSNSMRVDQEGMEYIFDVGHGVDKYNISGNKESYEFEINTNLSWTAFVMNSDEYDTSWLSVDTPSCEVKKVSTPTKSELQFSVTENNTGTMRYANIVVYSTEHGTPEMSGAGFREVITIYQHPKTDE